MHIAGSSEDDHDASRSVNIPMHDDVVKMSGTRLIQATTRASSQDADADGDGEQSVWSESYANGIRAISEALEAGTTPTPEDPVHTAFDSSHEESPSQSFDEYRETSHEYSQSEEDSEYDPELGLHDDKDDEEEDEEEQRTAAAVVAEEGRGLIVKGEGIPIARLQVHDGMTRIYSHFTTFY